MNIEHILLEQERRETEDIMSREKEDALYPKMARLFDEQSTQDE